MLTAVVRSDKENILIHGEFLELGDKTQRGKERFLFFYIARCLIVQLVYMSQIKQEIVANWETFFFSRDDINGGPNE